MSRTLRSAQSLGVINVSYEHRTSSPRVATDETQASAKGNADDNVTGTASTEVVEDSFKTDKSAHIARGAAVEPPQAARSNTPFDEYYDTTPQKPSQSSHLSRPGPSQAPPEQQDDAAGDPLSRRDSQTDAAIGASAVDEAAPTAAKTSSNPKLNSSAKQTGAFEQPVVRSAGGTTRAPRPTSSDKSTASTASSKAPTATSQTEAMTSGAKSGSGKLKAPSKPKTGALAALKAKRAGTAEAPEPQLSDEHEPPGKERKGHMQAKPAVGQADEDDQNAAPAARGKGKSAARATVPAPNTQPVDTRSRQDSQPTKPSVPPAVMETRRKKVVAVDNESEGDIPRPLKGAKAAAGNKAKASRQKKQASPDQDDEDVDKEKNGDEDGNVYEAPSRRAPAAKATKQVKKQSPRKHATRSGLPDSSYQPSQGKGTKRTKATARVPRTTPAEELRKSTRLTHNNTSFEPHPATFSGTDDNAEPIQKAEQQHQSGEKMEKSPHARSRTRAVASQEEPELSHSTRTTPVKDRLGTQENPEIISDNSTSSPLSDTHGKGPQDTEHKTPAARIGSSPPTMGGHQPGESLLNTAARAKKATVINFGTSGPRNQGALPSNTPGPRSTIASRPPKKIPLADAHVSDAKHSRASMPPVKAPEFRSQPKGHSEPWSPSFVASGKKVFRPAPSSNVANNFGDALAGMFKPKTAVQPHAARSREHGADKEQQQHVDLVDDFLVLDDEARSDCRSKAEDRTSAHSTARKPVSPPKEVKESLEPDILRTEESTSRKSIESVLAPEQVSVAPQAELLPARDTVVPVKEGPLKLRSQVKQVECSAPDGQQSTVEPVNMKKTYGRNAHNPADTQQKEVKEEQALKAGHMKLSKASKSDEAMLPPLPRPQQHQPGRTARTDRPPIADRRAQASPKPVIEIATKDSPKRKAATDVEPVNDRRTKRVKVADGDRVKVGETAAARQQPSLRANSQAKQTARTSQHFGKAGAGANVRQPSQASRTVDFNGSPAPSDMELRDAETVLENYSQQTNLSSDHATAPPKKLHESTAYYMRQEEVTDAHLSRQPDRLTEPLSSNSKPVPAPPNAESRALERVRVTDKQSRQLLEKSDNASILQDPFNDLQGLRHARSQPVRSELRLENVVAEQSHNMQWLDADAELEKFAAAVKAKTKERTIKPTMKQSPVRATMPRAKQLAIQHFSPQAVADHVAVNAVTSKEPTRPGMKQQMNYIRNVDTHPVFTERDELDETLVDHRDSVREQYEKHESLNDQDTAPIASLDGPTCVHWEDPMLDDYDLLDPPDFATLLKPHQLDLFDELVKCAQRLTMEMVHGENDTEHWLEQYHLRDQRMIEYHREKQAKHLLQLRADLKQKKQERMRELKQWTRKLHDWSRDLKQQREQHKQEAKVQGAFNVELEDFIDQL